MSVFADVTRCSLLHRGGEAQIYRLWAGSKSYVLKWYAAGCHFDSATVGCLLHERVDGVYRVVDAGEKNARPYLVYDFVEGLESNKFSPMPVAVALDALRQLVVALKTLSAKGIHHGDLNPANVLVGADGKVTLIDCGIVGPGSLPYAAPERFQSKPATEKSDAYSLGMLLYFWIAGEELVKAETYEEFADAATRADSLDPTTKLYSRLDSLVESGSLAGPETLTKLAPLWSALLRADPENRVEDLDELDELLEIAFAGVCGGEVAWLNSQTKFLKSFFSKSGTICNNEGETCEIPPEFAVMQHTGRNKKFLLTAFFVLILLASVLVVVLKGGRSNIDETGALMLKKSRSLDIGEAGLENGLDSAAVGVDGQSLKTLPVPDKDENE